MAALAPRLLVVRRGALGDTLLLIPLLRALRVAFPAHALHLAGISDYAQLLRARGVVDRARSSESLALWRLEASPLARAEAATQLLEFDWVLLDHGAEALAEHRARVACLELPQAAAPEPAAMQIAARTLARIGAAIPAPLPFATLCDARWPRAAPAIVVLHPGSGSRAKCWPAARWAELGDALRQDGLRVTVVVGEAERDRGDDLQDLVTHGLPVAAPASLTELVDILAPAAVFAGNDSGVTHLAAALRVPTVAVFGPTDPRVWAPAMPWVTVVGQRTHGPPEVAVAAVQAAVQSAMALPAGS